MSRTSCLRGFVWLVAGVATVWFPGVSLAADPVKGAGKFNSQDETVDVFAAMEVGQLEVTLIAKGSSQACLMVRNKTAKPLNVRLPAALAGVPVLAQLNFPFQQNGQANANTGPQPLGLGNPLMNPGDNLFGNQGNGRRQEFGIFNLAPEKVAQFRLPGVCLEHGWPNPKPQITYQLQPLDRVSSKPAVYELCAMLARGEVSQRAAQAAAWHLNNDMSWKTLKAERLPIAFGRLSQPYFTARELDEAQKAVETALERTNENSPTANASLSMKPFAW